MSLAGCQINLIDINFHLQKSLKVFAKNSANKIWSKKDKEIKVSPLMPIRVKTKTTHLLFYHLYNNHSGHVDRLYTHTLADWVSINWHFWGICKFFLKTLKAWINFSLQKIIFIPILGHGAPSDLQPHYGNGVFGNVYLLTLDNTKR